MEILAWLWWLATKLAGLAFGLVWFLIGGWVSTLAQIAVIAFLVFGWKYGWRRAPEEIVSRGGALGRYLWGWIRSREPSAARVQPARDGARERRGGVGQRVRQPGDVNLSTLLSLAVLAGLGVIAAL